jgi:PAS domain S-box-containing protein
MLNLWSLAQRSRPVRSNPGLGYPLAFLLVCLAVAARLLGGPVLTSFPFLTFYPAIVIAALLCGPGPAALAAVLGAGFSVYFLFDVTSTLRFEGVGLWIAIGFYACTNALIIALMDGMLRALEHQHATARRLQLAMDAGGMAVWEYDLAQERVIATPELNRLLGFPPAAQVGVAEIEALTVPGEWERLRAAGRQAIHAGEPYFELELQARRPDEALRWYFLCAEILRAPNGVVPEKILGVLSDVTGRKEIEQGLEDAVARLKEREKDLNAVLDASGIAPFDFDVDTMVFRPSPRLNQLYDYPVQHVLTIDHLRARYCPEEGEDYMLEAARRAADPGQRSYEVDLRLMMPDGKIKWLNGRGEYIRDHAGKAVRSRGLVMDVTARKELEQTRELLLQELEHRIKNTLATVGAITAQTLRGDITASQARKILDGRFCALGTAHELLTRHQWNDMNMGQVVEKALQPHHASGQIAIEGPDCPLSPKRALALTLALHELATNAIKYGALSVADGRVSLCWECDEAEKLVFTWRESGGPAVTVPARRGFGSQIIERVLAAEFAGQVSMDYCADGLVCSLAAPLHG